MLAIDENLLCTIATRKKLRLLEQNNTVIFRHQYKMTMTTIVFRK